MKQDLISYLKTKNKKGSFTLLYSRYFKSTTKNLRVSLESDEDEQDVMALVPGSTVRSVIPTLYAIACDIDTKRVDEDVHMSDLSIRVTVNVDGDDITGVIHSLDDEPMDTIEYYKPLLQLTSAIVVDEFALN